MSDTNILKAAFFTPGPRGIWGLPLRIIGKPGTAKTDLVTQSAAEVGLPTKVVIASLRDPTDFLGFPVVAGNGSVRYAPPDWALEVSALKRAVVFFDEINTCSPATQAALLRVVLDRVVGEYALPPTVRIVAAQNGVDDAAGGYDLAAPLANRFGTLSDWSGPDADAWTTWLVGSGSFGVETTTSAEQLEDRVSLWWPEAYSHATGIVSAFIRSRPSLLHSQPASGSPQASLSWPSHRTWAMATRALAASKLHGLTEDEADRYVGSFVGTSALSELCTFIANVDLPDPALLLDGKIRWKHDKNRLDRTVAVLSACASLVLPKAAQRRAERSVILWDMLAEVAKKSADVAWPTVRQLCRQGDELLRDGKKLHGSAKEILERFQPMLVSAGILSNLQE